MNQQQIKHRLIECRYPERFIDVVSKELLSVSSSLQPIVENWLIRGKEEDYTFNGYSLLDLCNTKGLQYPAAILTIDWIMKEPDVAVLAVNKKRR